MNRTKPSWNLKLLLSSSLVIGGMAIAPFDLTPTGFESSRVEAASTYTTTANLNLRLSAATWSPILLTIPSGASVKYVSTYGSWYKVSYGGKTGYVASQYIKVSSASTITPSSASYYKTTVNLNMRLTAASWSTVLMTIPNGATVKYVSRYGSWYKVSYNGKTGYVASQYLSATGAPTTTTSTTSYQTTVNLNMRLTAASWSKVLMTIPNGSTVKYVSKYGSWYKVSYGGKTGYVASQYLKPATTTTPTTSTGTGRTIVIDAGHGGNDPGAVYGSSYEKVIAFDIAARLASTLSNTYGYNARMTRTNDVYLSLAQRVELTKSYKGSAFVSIHNNSSTNTSYHGHEVLVPTGESYTTNPYISASRSLGAAINRELGARIPTIRNRGVKYQNVYVVGKNSVPSTLVEYGFISNANDRSHLTSTTYRQRMADATASGIHQFMSTYK
ncbi:MULTISPECIES: N-acetylmuramoyl-L-alanine amidase [unclassified Exiguobacterium]|uniref:N-acetylmuramoyl-L-alanine amidase n=1 Tax=unclassified Exiguobacterium TaxID=2644629 RepID=UPI00103AF279|nr:MULTISPECIES: N-acetylmuramoyl-L-alanine amidase [unclassified Exiguobacterium]TCI66619.1 cell wall hydrolase [Exiguobacterium sp. IPCI3]TCI75791.1 cell wall hydrolase [Exiguobacterium sp. IPCH1]TCI76736.1 cell wall hydrolase [Exiguobacterium sp. IPBC4]